MGQGEVIAFQVAHLDDLDIFLRLLDDVLLGDELLQPAFPFFRRRDLASQVKGDGLRPDLMGVNLAGVGPIDIFELAN